MNGACPPLPPLAKMLMTAGIGAAEIDEKKELLYGLMGGCISCSAA